MFVGQHLLGTAGHALGGEADHLLPATALTAATGTVEGSEGTVVGCALGKLLAVGFDIHGGSNSVRICGNGHRLIRSHGASGPTIIN